MYKVFPCIQRYLLGDRETCTWDLTSCSRHLSLFEEAGISQRGVIWKDSKKKCRALISYDVFWFNRVEFRKEMLWKTAGRTNVWKWGRARVIYTNRLTVVFCHKLFSKNLLTKTVPFQRCQLFMFYSFRLFCFYISCANQIPAWLILEKHFIQLENQQQPLGQKHKDNWNIFFLLFFPKRLS